MPAFLRYELLNAVALKGMKKKQVGGRLIVVNGDVTCGSYPLRNIGQEEATQQDFINVAMLTHFHLINYINRSSIFDYAHEDICNFDETSFFYKLGPTSKLASGPAAGKKRNKERITVGLMCNASGTYKVKLIVVGKAKLPKWFGKTFDPSIYCTYEDNKKAWMGPPIFHRVPVKPQLIED